MANTFYSPEREETHGIPREVVAEVAHGLDHTVDDRWQHLGQDQPDITAAALVEARRLRELGEDPGDAFLRGVDFYHEITRTEETLNDFLAITEGVDFAPEKSRYQESRLTRVITAFRFARKAGAA